MDEEMVNRFSRFKLKGKEEAGVELEQKDMRRSREECEISLLGRIWGEKTANLTGIKSTFGPLWCHRGSLRVIELDTNFFQFFFSDKGERDRVLLKRPWFFDNQFLILQKWEPKMQKEDERFISIPLWIQISGLPQHWVSKEVGWKLGTLFHKCLNVILTENGTKQGRLVKILAEVDLKNPLLRGTKLNLEGEQEWIEFKYESLPGFCFYCGCIGHQEKTCEVKVEDSHHDRVCEGQYGIWLRASSARGAKGSGLHTRAEGGNPDSRLRPGHIQGFEGTELTRGQSQSSHDYQGYAVMEEQQQERRVMQNITKEQERPETEGEQMVIETKTEGIAKLERSAEPGKVLVLCGSGLGGGSKPNQSLGDNLQHTREGLIELDQNVIGMLEARRKESRNESVKKWKRQPRSDHSLSGAGTNEQQVLNNNQENKRVFQHLEESEDQPEVRGNDKKLKRTESLSCIYDEQVGVASLEWPQMNQ